MSIKLHARHNASEWTALRRLAAEVGVLGALLCSGCATAATPVDTGRYCLAEPLVADTGRDSFPLGNFTMSAVVRKTSSGYRVDFQNKMPDSSEILQGGGDATVKGDGSLSFRFEDGWGNSGRGRLAPSGTITLEAVRQTPDVWGRNILRNYGTYELSRAACDHPAFAPR